MNRKLSQGSKTSKMEVLISEQDKKTIVDTAQSLNMTASEFIRETVLAACELLRNNPEVTK